MLGNNGESFDPRLGHAKLLHPVEFFLNFTGDLLLSLFGNCFKSRHIRFDGWDKSRMI